MSPVVAENEQIGPNEADDIKNDEFKRKNTGIVCRITHNDGIRQQSLIL